MFCRVSFLIGTALFLYLFRYNHYAIIKIPINEKAKHKLSKEKLMTTTNQYETMSAISALNLAQNRKLLLPDIQREYVWDICDIEALFESIVDDYPIGSCILWKTDRDTINTEKPNLYYFFNTYKKGKTKNEKAPEVFIDENYYYIVLDGQQRITSLNIALFGSYTYYKGGKGHLRSNHKSWLTKELYYNLDYDKTSNADDEHPRKRFCFLTTNEANEGNYFKVKSWIPYMIKYKNIQQFADFMRRENYNEQSIKSLILLYERLFSSSGNGLIHYYCINEKSYDAALDIFVRVNSTGRKLSKSDLLFSTLIDGWKVGKESVDQLLEDMNRQGDGFAFNRDYLMRLCLVLTDSNTNLKINSFNKTAVTNIRNEWDHISDTLYKTVSVLKNLGMSHENLCSYNATMPIAYYIYKGGTIQSDEQEKEVRKFLSVSFAKRLFGIASNEALNVTRNALKNIDCTQTPFSLALFKNITLTGARTFTVTESDIDYWLDNYEKGQNTYTLLSLLYPNLKLSQFSFHQDHCHPYAGFEEKHISELGLSPEKIEEWKKKRNLLPNLQFLEGSENESKNQTPLKKWVSPSRDFLYHPKDVSLELKDFDTFFEARKAMMKNKLMEIFEI